MNARLLLVLLLALIVPGVARGDSAWNTVWRSETALERTSVVGTAQTTLARDGKTISAQARVMGDRGKTRFDYQTQRRQWSLIDDGRQLLKLNPAQRTVLALARPPLVIDRALAERNYLAREVGQASVANRRTRVVEIAPRRGGPPVMKLWLEDDTDFALRRERYTMEGRLATSTEFLSVEFGAPVPSATFRAPEGWPVTHEPSPAPAVPLDVLSERLGIPVHSPRYLPEGYDLVGTYAASHGRWEREMAEFRYTDGIRSLSVFERNRESRQEGGRGRRGAGAPPPGRGRGGRRGGERGRGFGPPDDQVTVMEHGHEKALRYLGKTHVVMVVGDLPTDELLQIARSVEHN